MLYKLIGLFLLLISTFSFAEDQKLNQLFQEKNLNGTIVLSSLHGNETVIHNDSRAKTQYPSASTFKILNSLIAVEEHILQDKQSVIKWNGTQYPKFPSWNKDQTLESAYKASCVWCYQWIADQVGADKYQKYIRVAQFGTLKEPFKTNQFWLDGSLTISAIEQIKFLKQVYNKSLPFSSKSYDTLREISLVEKTPDYAIYAKTGWAMDAKPQIGWYVGYIETHHDVWFFAMNIDIQKDSDLPLRQQLVKHAFLLKNIIK